MIYRRRRSSLVNRLLPCLREEARRFARFPAENARYPLFPQVCCTSRETVLGARPNRLAMAASPVPGARPRLTFSRSADESRRSCVVVCIRIHRTHIRCVRCLTPRANTPPVFPGLRPRIWPHLLRLVTNGNVGQAPSPHYSRALLLQSRMPDSSETGETGGESATGRDRVHTSRESRSSRLSHATAPFHEESS